MGVDTSLTAATRRRYDRLAPVYDASEIVVERFLYAPWRRRLWEGVTGPAILEVGVGTGKNMSYYPPGAHVTGIDISEGMLSRARRRAHKLALEVDLRLMDAETLAFPSQSFDTVVASFVFCSVPDPVAGLRELGRVCKQGGEIRLLEHMRAGNELLGRLMDLVNPLAVRIQGANINRSTVDNVRSAGLQIQRIEELSVQGIFKLIVAHPPVGQGTAPSRIARTPGA